MPDNEIVSFFGNSEGRLQVQRQVEDYALRGREFEEMGFLTFTVETYERRIQEKRNDNVDEEFQRSTRIQGGRYLSTHSKAATHYRVFCVENHNALPNIVGPWLPRRDGEPDTRSFYYAAMLSLLKPWRDLRDLKREDETWEMEFNIYMKEAVQRDKDVIAGAQYYYESKNIVANRNDDEDGSDERDDNSNDDEAVITEDDLQFESTSTAVSIVIEKEI